MVTSSKPLQFWKAHSPIFVTKVWEYFKEDELFEGIVNGNLIIIATCIEPLERYNEDYNLDNLKRKLVPKKK